MSKIVKLFAQVVLNVLPTLVFPKLNAFLFRLRGYNVNSKSRVYSTVKMIGQIGINVGEGTYIGNQTTITGGEANIIIGRDCDISDHVHIVCGSHEIDASGERIAGKGIGKDIVIGNGVWIGYGALILPGVTIGDRSVIGAGCVVTKDVEGKTVVAGNPMREIRKL